MTQTAPMNLNVPRLLWAGILASQAMLGLVAFFFLRPKHEEMPPLVFDLEHLVPAGLGTEPGRIWALGFVVLALSFVLPRVFAKQALLIKQQGALREPQAVLAVAFTPFVLGLSLVQACSLCGLVAGNILSRPGNPMLFVVPALAATLVLLTRFPTEASMRALAGQEPD